MKSKRGSSATGSAKGKTDWARVRAMKDADIPFTADAPRTSAEDWVDAVAHRGLPPPARKRKEQIALRVDADVLAWYRSQGPGWQTRMNAVLKAAFRDRAAKPM